MKKNILNYEKLMEQKPTVYETMINSLGQTIDLVEHPTRGDCYPVICVCHSLKLVGVSTFFDTDDMIDANREYEPTFEEGKLLIGGFIEE